MVSLTSRFKFSIVQLIVIFIVQFYYGFAFADESKHDTKKTLIAFAPDGLLTAKIKITAYGVPHIEASNLESLGFGNGYAQAKDNLCLIADEFLRVNSERAKYFGPDKEISGDNKNIISDFGIKALGIRALAEDKLSGLSDNTRALISGFTAGYNYYLNKIKTQENHEEQRDPVCYSKPWLKPIDSVDVLTRLFAVSLIAGSANFLPQLFYANPGDSNEFQPKPVLNSVSKKSTTTAQYKMILAYNKPNKLPTLTNDKIGSNGWGIGKNKSENGRGLILSNTHFPHSGMLRFWQWHATIPGVMDVMGASSIGVPGVVNIGFNKTISWTHTVSAAEHFIVYQLALVPGNRNHYYVDGIEKSINSKTATIEVKMGDAVITLEKQIYFTDLGPVLETPTGFNWDDKQAFVIKDANLGNTDSVDHWLAMNLAKNLTEFKQAFKDYDGMLFNNTIYADKKGYSYYIDNSTVPGLSPAAIALIKNDPVIAATRKQLGFTVLPGHLSQLIYNDIVSFKNAPQLVRKDFVQNGNDSYWMTNPNSVMTGYSPLYGGEQQALSLRTRMGLKMLEDSAGDDALFSLQEIETALLSNRAYLPELILDDLLTQCEKQGTQVVKVSDTVSVDISHGCRALSKWNGRQDSDSIAGHLIREFAYIFSRDNYFAIPFDPMDPANTPRNLINDESVLVVLANAIANIEAAGWQVDDKLGDIMFVERTLANGLPSEEKIPWFGAHNIEGGFTTVSSIMDRDDSIFAKHSYPTSNDVITGEALESQLSSEGYQIRFGTGWIMLVGFENNKPKARGILTYSQSTNANSDHYDDQTQIFADKKSLRTLVFDKEDIEENLVSSQVIKFQRKNAIKK